MTSTDAHGRAFPHLSATKDCRDLSPLAKVLLVGLSLKGASVTKT